MPIEEATLPPAADTARALLATASDQRRRSLRRLPAPAPISSVADVVAVNNEDLANRVPFGQAFLEGAAADTTTPAEYDRVRTVAQAIARTG